MSFWEIRGEVDFQVALTVLELAWYVNLIPSWLSFDLSLQHCCALLAAIEHGAAAVHVTFSRLLNISRDASTN